MEAEHIHMFSADRPGTVSFNRTCDKANIQQMYAKHIKIENTPAWGRQAQTASQPIPQDVFRDTADNILPDFTIKTISYLWQDATHVHPLGILQHEQGNTNLCCSCNEALI